MNKWIKKSIDLANSKGYLDKLFRVYPVELGVFRDVSEELKIKVKQAFKNKNKLYLIKTLLGLPKFPIDDPYIASLRRHPDLLNKNPKTVKRIGEKLLSIDIDTILELTTQPKSPSRQFGYSFKNWLRTLQYPFLEEKKFIKSNRAVFLEGSDEKLKQFAIKELSIKNLKKGIDFILKVKAEFILGEAKFLTDYGGTQNNQFNDAIKIAKISKGNIMGIAVLDGIVWFESDAYMHRTIKRIRGSAISALLLNDFIKEKM